MESEEAQAAGAECLGRFRKSLTADVFHPFGDQLSDVTPPHNCHGDDEGAHLATGCYRLDRYGRKSDIRKTQDDASDPPTKLPHQRQAHAHRDANDDADGKANPNNDRHQLKRRNSATCHQCQQVAPRAV